MSSWFHRSLVAIDIAINVIMFQGEYETISVRAYRAQRDGHRWAVWLCKFLDKVQLNHCDRSARNELEFAKRRIAILEKVINGE